MGRLLALSRTTQPGIDNSKRLREDSRFMTSGRKTLRDIVMIVEHMDGRRGGYNQLLTLVVFAIIITTGNKPHCHINPCSVLLMVRIYNCVIYNHCTYSNSFVANTALWLNAQSSYLYPQHHTAIYG